MKCIVCGKDAVKLIGNEIGRDVYAERSEKSIFDLSALPYPEYLAFCNKHDYEDYTKKQDKKGDIY